ncbi:hypothetical protein POM88_019670 [Heracleum sosnowskyi]|uniref:Uncharacterized protein n=1 Tax=Heracleum sosnowskyi TaxID=360622 RepID=A0AAD8IAL2_9APIA|nr:hypothetical protein POM88_019670 [Heracleum sosnowskyi]
MQSVRASESQRNEHTMQIDSAGIVYQPQTDQANPFLIPQNSRAPIDLVTVLDVSGSMAGWHYCRTNRKRLPLVGSGVIGMLREGILLGILMNMQPSPILRPFRQNDLLTEYTASYHSGDSTQTCSSGKFCSISVLATYL